MKAEEYFINKHYAMDRGMLPFSLVMELMDDFAEHQNKELIEQLQNEKDKTEYFMQQLLRFDCDRELLEINVNSHLKTNKK